MKEVLYFILAALIVLAILFIPVFLIDYVSCTSKAAAMEMECKYSIMTSCMIEVEPGQWIPLENYRYFGED